MAQYRAVVTIEFDDDDLENSGFEGEDPHDVLFGELQNFGLGCAWIDELYRNEKPVLLHLGEDE